MAKILVAGTAHIKKRLHEYNCTACESKIEFDEATDRLMTDDGPNRRSYYYECPVCIAWISASRVEAT